MQQEAKKSKIMQREDQNSGSKDSDMIPVHGREDEGSDSSGEQ